MGSSWALLGKEPPAAPSSQRGPRALAPWSVERGRCSPVLEPVLRVLQPGLQVPDAHLLLLQRGQVLLRGGRLDAMVVAAQHVLQGAPARGRLSPGGTEKRTATGGQPRHPGPPTTRGFWVRPPRPGPVGAGEHPALFWKVVGFIRVLLSEDHSVRAGSSGSSHWGGGDVLENRRTSLAPCPSVQPQRELRDPASQPRERVWGWKLGWDDPSLLLICTGTFT